MLKMWPTIVNMNVEFLIVDTPNNVNNAILGRRSLNKVKVIVSTLHLLMKFPTVNGIG